MPLIFLLLMMFFVSVWPARAEHPFMEVSIDGHWGVAWGDFNGDGLPDLWVGNHLDPPNLYLNEGLSGFADIANETVPLAVREDDAHGAAWGDFDNDGDQDLIELVGADRGQGDNPNHLFVSASGVLVDEAASRGIDYPLGRGRTPLWLDYDNDGRLDLFLANAKRPDGLAGSALFRQEDKGFVNVNTLVGINLKHSSEFAQLADLTGDDRPELIVHSVSVRYPQAVYDMTTTPFKNITKTIGIPQFKKVNDVAIADLNGDLRQDFYLCHRIKGDQDAIILSGPQGFTVTELESGSLCTSVVAADFDNDMDVDLLVISGDPASSLNTSAYLENQGSGQFVPHGFTLGSPPMQRIIAAVADYNIDGLVDVFIAALNQHLYRNTAAATGNTNSWIQIDLQGVQSNRDGIGARILLEAGGVTQVREQGGGMHLYAQNHARIHFGLGQNTKADKITVLWPGGVRQELRDVPANQVIRIIEEATAPALPPKGGGS